MSNMHLGLDSRSKMGALVEWGTASLPSFQQSILLISTVLLKVDVDV